MRTIVKCNGMAEELVSDTQSISVDIDTEYFINTPEPSPGSSSNELSLRNEILGFGALNQQAQIPKELNDPIVLRRSINNFDNEIYCNKTDVSNDMHEMNGNESQLPRSQAFLAASGYSQTNSQENNTGTQRPLMNQMQHSRFDMHASQNGHMQEQHTDRQENIHSSGLTESYFLEGSQMFQNISGSIPNVILSSPNGRPHPQPVEDYRTHTNYEKQRPPTDVSESQVYSQRASDSNRSHTMTTRQQNTAHQNIYQDEDMFKMLDTLLNINDGSANQQIQQNHAPNILMQLQQLLARSQMNTRESDNSYNKNDAIQHEVKLKNSRIIVNQEKRTNSNDTNQTRRTVPNPDHSREQNYSFHHDESIQKGEALQTNTQKSNAEQYRDHRAMNHNQHMRPRVIQQPATNTTKYQTNTRETQPIPQKLQGKQHQIVQTKVKPKPPRGKAKSVQSRPKTSCFCHMCDAGFTDKFALNRHEQMHEDNRTIMCKECGFLADTLADLYGHFNPKTDTCGPVKTKASFSLGNAETHIEGPEQQPINDDPQGLPQVQDQGPNGRQGTISQGDSYAVKQSVGATPGLMHGLNVDYVDQQPHKPKRRPDSCASVRPCVGNEDVTLTQQTNQRDPNKQTNSMKRSLNVQRDIQTDSNSVPQNIVLSQDRMGGTRIFPKQCNNPMGQTNPASDNPTFKRPSNHAGGSMANRGNMSGPQVMKAPQLIRNINRNAAVSFKDNMPDIQPDNEQLYHDNKSSVMLPKTANTIGNTVQGSHNNINSISHADKGNLQHQNGGKQTPIPNEIAYNVAYTVSYGNTIPAPENNTTNTNSKAQQNIQPNYAENHQIQAKIPHNESTLNRASQMYEKPPSSVTQTSNVAKPGMVTGTQEFPTYYETLPFDDNSMDTAENTDHDPEIDNVKVTSEKSKTEKQDSTSKTANNEIQERHTLSKQPNNVYAGDPVPKMDSVSSQLGKEQSLITSFFSPRSKTDGAAPNNGDANIISRVTLDANLPIANQSKVSPNRFVQETVRKIHESELVKSADFVDEIDLNAMLPENTDISENNDLPTSTHKANSLPSQTGIQSVERTNQVQPGASQITNPNKDSLNCSNTRTLLIPPHQTRRSQRNDFNQSQEDIAEEEGIIESMEQSDSLNVESEVGFQNKTSSKASRGDIPQVYTQVIDNQNKNNLVAIHDENIRATQTQLRQGSVMLSCPICNLDFNDTKSFKFHFKLRHPKEPIPPMNQHKSPIQSPIMEGKSQEETHGSSDFEVKLSQLRRNTTDKRQTLQQINPPLSGNTTPDLNVQLIGKSGERIQRRRECEAGHGNNTPNKRVESLDIQNRTETNECISQTQESTSLLLPETDKYKEGRSQNVLHQSVERDNTQLSFRKDLQTPTPLNHTQESMKLYLSGSSRHGHENAGTSQHGKNEHGSHIDENYLPQNQSQDSMDLMFTETDSNDINVGSNSVRIRTHNGANSSKDDHSFENYANDLRFENRDRFIDATKNKRRNEITDKSSLQNIENRPVISNDVTASMLTQDDVDKIKERIPHPTSNNADAACISAADNVYNDHSFSEGKRHLVHTKTANLPQKEKVSKPFKCIYCNEQFMLPKVLRKHQQTMHEDKPLTNVFEMKEFFVSWAKGADINHNSHQKAPEYETDENKPMLSSRDQPKNDQSNTMVDLRNNGGLEGTIENNVVAKDTTIQYRAETKLAHSKPLLVRRNLRDIKERKRTSNELTCEQYIPQNNVNTIRSLNDKSPTPPIKIAKRFDHHEIQQTNDAIYRQIIKQKSENMSLDMRHAVDKTLAKTNVSGSSSQYRTQPNTRTGEDNSSKPLSCEHCHRRFALPKQLIAHHHACHPNEETLNIFKLKELFMQWAKGVDVK